MIDFDLTVFSDLNDEKKSLLRSHIDSAIEAKTVSEIKQYAVDCFKIIAPNISTNLLLSSTKKFSELKYTEENARAGIYVYRAFFAHLIHAKRKQLNVPKTVVFTGQASSDFDRYGYAEVNSFLDLELLSKVRAEIEKFPISVSKNQQNVISNLSESNPLRTVLDHSDMKKYIFSCIGYPLDHAEANDLYQQNTFVQKLHNVNTDGDVQKILHSDTFFPCIKWWYFPHKVDIDDGPFAYVSKSHKLTYDILEFMYQQSIEITRNEIIPERTYGHEEGSFRIFENELDKMMLFEVKLYVPANTLVIGNVFGFHRRSQVKNEAKRFSIHGSIRTNHPFD